MCMKKGSLILMVLLLYVCATSVYANEIVTDKEEKGNIFGSNVTMHYLKSDNPFDLYKTVEIEDGNYIKSQIAAYEEEIWAYSSEDSFSNIAMLAFSRWCRKFLNKSYDFEVYQLFLTKGIIVSNNSGSGYINSKKQEGNIRYVPFISDRPINKALSSGKIVVAISKDATDGKVSVTLDAIIPFEGRYYKYLNTFIFGCQLNFRGSNRNNVESLSKSTAKHLVDYVDRNGGIVDAFFVQYLRWRFKSMGNHELQRLNIHPKRENITIKSLFYDND